MQGLGLVRVSQQHCSNCGTMDTQGFLSLPGGGSCRLLSGSGRPTAPSAGLSDAPNCPKLYLESNSVFYTKTRNVHQSQFGPWRRPTEGAAGYSTLQEANSNRTLLPPTVGSEALVFPQYFDYCGAVGTPNWATPLLEMVRF